MEEVYPPSISKYAMPKRPPRDKPTRSDNRPCWRPTTGRVFGCHLTVTATAEISVSDSFPTRCAYYFSHRTWGFLCGPCWRLHYCVWTPYASWTNKEYWPSVRKIFFFIYSLNPTVRVSIWSCLLYTSIVSLSRRMVQRK